VLITGAGGPGSEALAKKWKHHEIIFADSKVQRIHPSISKQSRVEIPMGSSSDFYEQIGLIIRKFGIEVVVSQVDEELEALNLLQNELRTFELITPGLNFVKLCNNKAALGENLRLRGILEPNTEQLSPRTQRRLSNMVFKPSFGRGSRGIFFFRDDCSFEDLKRYLLSTNVPYIVQDEILGEEYTVQVMANRQGMLKAIVPVQVFEKRGSTTSCQISLNKNVISTVMKLHEAFLPLGTYNVQLIVNSETKNSSIIEINPRVSTTLCLSLEVGLDPIDLFFDDTDCLHEPKSELFLNRYWTNFFSTSE
jgi:carbamoyl-phosphate synthase large subunit